VGPPPFTAQGGREKKHGSKEKRTSVPSKNFGYISGPRETGPCGYLQQNREKKFNTRVIKKKVSRKINRSLWERREEKGGERKKGLKTWTKQPWLASPCTQKKIKGKAHPNKGKVGTVQKKAL